jgi:hypothetical protein
MLGEGRYKRDDVSNVVHDVPTHNHVSVGDLGPDLGPPAQHLTMHHTGLVCGRRERDQHLRHAVHPDQQMSAGSKHHAGRTPAASHVQNRVPWGQSRQSRPVGGTLTGRAGNKQRRRKPLGLGRRSSQDLLGNPHPASWSAHRSAGLK